jgi:hypothetical protein
MDDLDEIIILQLRGLAADTGEFIAGLLYDELTDEKQISFAHRLVDAAEAIRERATPPQVIDGSATDDHPATRRTDLPAGS